MRHCRQSTARLSCCVQQSNFWVERIATLMHILEVTGSDFSLYTAWIWQNFNGLSFSMGLRSYCLATDYFTTHCRAVWSASLETLTTVNLNTVVRTTALLLVGLCGQCIWRCPVIRLCAFGKALYPGIWLVASPLAFAPKDRKFATISILRVGFQPAISVPERRKT
jgi:hypothetical protein